MVACEIDESTRLTFPTGTPRSNTFEATTMLLMSATSMDKLARSAGGVTRIPNDAMYATNPRIIMRNATKAARLLTIMEPLQAFAAPAGHCLTTRGRQAQQLR